MSKRILIKPLVTEKTERLSESGKFPQYTFVVNKAANKIEIKSAIEEMYSVTVKSVNTMIMPSRRKSRMTRTGVQKGAISSYKKAIVTLPEGEEIDFYGEV